MRLFTLQVDEPLPGKVLPDMVAEHGAEEAARRYRAVAVTTLRQLQGLAETRLRLIVRPDDGAEAVRFWLLPRLAHAWDSGDGVFRSHGWDIDFGGTDEVFSLHARGEILCPFLGARWVHTALLGLGRTTGEVIGTAVDGGEYFRAVAPIAPADALPRVLPSLPIIRTPSDWQEAMDSPLGPALKRAWEEEGV